jgi:hypothetical protein
VVDVQSLQFFICSWTPVWSGWCVLLNNELLVRNQLENGENLKKTLKKIIKGNSLHNYNLLHVFLFEPLLCSSTSQRWFKFFPSKEGIGTLTLCYILYTSSSFPNRLCC